jgi:hypothetical protein
LLFDFGQLGDAALVTATFELGGKERRHNFFGETDSDDSCANRQHIGVVVRARHLRGVQAIAQRRAHTAHFVGGQLLALPTAAEDNADLGLAITNGPTDSGADGWIVNAVGGMGAEIFDLVARSAQECNEMLLQFETRVICTDCDVKFSAG